MEITNYTFYSQTTSLCEECLSLVPAKIIFENDCVYLLKYCSIHKHHKTLISTDINYFKRCRDIRLQSIKPNIYQTEIDKGCPFDCGLCEDHENYTALGIVEILDECNFPNSF